MPDLPAQIVLPPMTPDAANATAGWAMGLQQTLTRLWAQLHFVVNGLSKVDTLANRRSTPIFNEAFFTASNTKQTFAGVAGVWENVGPRRGSATILAAATTVAVTLSPAEPDANYRLSLSTNYSHGGLWWTLKATTGWTINAATAAPGGGATVDWTLTRD